VGCLDAAAGALGAGVTRVGQTNEQGGQAGGFAISLDRVVVEPRLIFSHHVLPGQYLLQAGTVGGGALSWFRDVFGQAEVDAGALIDQSPFELFSAQVVKTPAGAHGVIFIPYMAGERTPLWSSTARGVFFGLSYSTTRRDILRAILEGCAFAVYDNVRLAEQHGATVQEYLGSGGATHSAVWCQIKADVYNRPFIVARRADGGEGGHMLGLYALTAKAVGLCDDAGECVERLLPKRQVFEPSPDRHALYESLFEVYLDVSRKLLDSFERLAAIKVG
jgi:xylulokinase